MNTQTAFEQLDLFDLLNEACAGTVSPRYRKHGGLQCLIDAVPTALECVVDLHDPQNRKGCSAGRSGDWWYAVTRDGLRFDDDAQLYSGRTGSTVGRHNRLPGALLSWDELRALVEHDPRRAEIVEWAASLPQPNWKPKYRPHELWPNPGNWHASYITGDHSEPGWATRKRMWDLTLAILRDAQDALAK